LPRICILEEGKLCDDCCECYVCDLDPERICDSCGKCLETADYTGIIVDDIFVESGGAVARHGQRKKLGRNGPQGKTFRIVRRTT